MHDEFYSNHYVSPFLGISQKSQKKIKSSLYGLGGKSYKPLVETRTLHFARPKVPSRRERIFTNSAAITRIGNCIIYSFAPWNTTWHCFYPINPKVRAKMADIVNKVYCAIKKKQQNGEAPNWIRYARSRHLDRLVFRESKYFLTPRGKREEKKIEQYYNTMQNWNRKPWTLISTKRFVSLQTYMTLSRLGGTSA